MINYKDKILEYLKNTLNTEDINETTLLLENGLLDSLGIIALISFLETEFQISLSDVDFDINNFSTVECLVNNVLNK